MLQKARGIALHSVRYGDSNMVAYFYTRELGRITLMVYGAYGKGKRSKKAIYCQPLTLSDLVYYEPKAQGMGRLKEISAPFVSVSIASSPIKSAIALFLGEVIYRVVREEEGDPALYSFLELSIISLDTIEEGVENFHLIFLAQLSKYLGFYPKGGVTEQSPYFDYSSGTFVEHAPSHEFYFPLGYSKLLHQALTHDYHSAYELDLIGLKRTDFLALMLKFYQYHTDSYTTFQSLEILHQVFSR